MDRLEIVAPRTSGEIDFEVVLKKDGFGASAWLKWLRKAGLQCTLGRPPYCPDNGVHLILVPKGKSRFIWGELAGPTRLEFATSGVTGRRSSIALQPGEPTVPKLCSAEA
jgi:hypothetical protein